MNANRSAWLLCYGLLAGLGAAACTDPGCIRNSECGMDYVCVRAICTPKVVDSGGPSELDPLGDDAGQQ